ncbi:DNA-binding protein SMUBP-2 [Nymphon striatum]|nr:DNA-binding protein SMUBP-2 [Nymphon striatum]
MKRLYPDFLSLEVGYVIIHASWLPFSTICGTKQQCFEMDLFVAKHQLLIKEEHEYELEEAKLLRESCNFKELQEKGFCITKLQISHHCTGLYGRKIVTFESISNNQQALPSHSITNVDLKAEDSGSSYSMLRTDQMQLFNATHGDIVGVIVNTKNLSADSSDPDLKNDVSGIVVRVHPRYVNVAFDVQDHSSSSSSLLWLLEEKDNLTLNLIKLANNVTYKRLKSCLNYLHKSSATTLSNVLFGNCQPADPLPSFVYKNGDEISFVNKNLNDCQMEAVLFALKQKDLAIIHGPPGTGKTTTIVEVIVQAVLCGQKVLACAPSNVAVDNLIERLVEHKKIKVVRLGHPARSMKSLHKYSLDAIISSSSYSADVVNGVRKDIDSKLVYIFNLFLHQFLMKFTLLNSNFLFDSSSHLKLQLGKTHNAGQRKLIQQELKFLKKELFAREKNCLKQVLQGADVILSTLTSASGDGPLKNLLNVSNNNPFDLVVVDECSQAIEVACWIALAHSNKCILAGDHLQLPPTILCEKAAKNGLGISLMQRLLDMFKKESDLIMRMLTMQYRMHSDIMTWPSNQLYNGQLKAHSCVASHLVTDLEGVVGNSHTDPPLLLIDTAGCDLHELDVAEDMSKANQGEIDLVAMHVEILVSSGVNPSHIGIISPYNLQVELIKIKLDNKYGNKIEIKSIDSFQGREKEVIIISFVRSNIKREVGFLTENRRINVAITRARRQLAIICDSQTISKDPFMKSLMTYMNEHGEVMSAAMFDLQNDNSSKEERLFLDKVHMKMEKKHENVKKKNIIKKQKQIFTNPSNKQLVVVEEKEFQKHREELIKQNIEKTINDFVEDTRQKSKEFPSDLSSYERMLVHQFCEQLGLKHESCGEEQERHIVIEKKETHSVTDKLKCDTHPSKDDKCEQVPPTRLEIQSNSTDVTESLKSDIKVIEDDQCLQMCSNCNKNVSKQNFLLHQVRCYKIEENVVKKKAPKQIKSLKKQLNKTGEEDIDSLVNDIVKIDSTCSFDKCDTNIKLIGQKCSHCGKKFCLSHCIPEVHGCSLAAKIQARNQMRANMKTSLNPNSLSGKPSMSRPALEKKLGEKLKKISRNRHEKQN